MDQSKSIRIRGAGEHNLKSLDVDIPRDRLVVALDVDDVDRARVLVRTLLGRVGMFKVGLELFTLAGPPIVQEIDRAGGAVFLDLKLHDIPNTVARAAARAARLGVRLLTVHALGGPAMIEAAVRGAREEAARRDRPAPRVLATRIPAAIPWARRAGLTGASHRSG